MDNKIRLEIFKLQTDNVRDLKKAIGQIRRTINYAYRKNDNVTARVQTKILALIYCAWAEANFFKVVHTPHGFNLNEIQQIKKVYKKQGVEAGWLKCVDIGLAKVAKSKTNIVDTDARKKIFNIINKYIIEPSLIRNKIAHGQWVNALNRKNTAKNEDITNKLNNLNIVTIYDWIETNKHLTQIVENLIESPKAFQRDYKQLTTDILKNLKTSEKRTLVDKIKLLKKKPSNRDSAPSK